MKLLASLIFFTRLPFWRIREVPASAFKHIVPYWPYAGWVTGGVMAGTFWAASHFLPLTTAWIIALAARLLVTGALHEDGLADFFDGFGGGRSREHTLAIMKDSHIGTYGVLALVIYFLLLTQLLQPVHAAAVIFCGDCYSKMVASHLINLLPYARKEEESKARVIYDRMTGREVLINTAGGLIFPLILLPGHLLYALLVPPFVLLGLYFLMKRRIQGYTGDCCGAAFLLCELSYYIAAAALAPAHMSGFYNIFDRLF